MVSRYDPAAVPTIWRRPEALWAECQPLLPPAKPPGAPGRPAIPYRPLRRPGAGRDRVRDTQQPPASRR